MIRLFRQLKKEKNVVKIRKGFLLKMVLRFIIYNVSIPKYIRQEAVLYSVENVTQKERCVLTGNGRSVFSQFKLNRIALRFFSSHNYVQGVKKSSW